MTVTAPGLQEAIRAWTAALGADHVVGEGAALDAAGTATFATSSRVLAILRPGTREEVQACVRIANRYQIPIYPVSSGRNWGYGSRAPVTDSVLLELGRMNRIRRFDADLAYVTIEPGVTQSQLHEFLTADGSRLWMDATGSSPECSIIGNTLERGFGHTPMGDHSASACGLEVVLPTGECVTTGFGQFESAATTPVSRGGVGPSIDGLFLQSNLGIVTAMTVWLMPAPEHFEAFFFLCDDERALAGVVDALRPLKLNGTLRSVMHIGNDYKVLAASGAFPWGRVPDGPVTPAVMAEMRRQHGIAPWGGSGGLYGTKGQVREAKRQLRKALSGRVSQLRFLDDRLLGLLDRFSRPIGWVMRRDMTRMVKVIKPVYDLLKGVPTDETMASAYWRKPNGPPPAGAADPDRDGCGLLWCSPVVPLQGTSIAEVTDLAAEILLGHGFEPQVSVSLATERMAICVVTITYDRAQPGADELAMRCYQQLSAKLMESGYPLYRRNVAAMAATSQVPEYAALIRELKSALDPNGILAPGRYEAPAARAGKSRALGVAS